MLAAANGLVCSLLLSAVVVVNGFAGTAKDQAAVSGPHGGRFDNLTDRLLLDNTLVCTWTSAITTWCLPASTANQSKQQAQQHSLHPQAQPNYADWQKLPSS